jgi:methionine biosynthesis protein MetW
LRLLTFVLEHIFKRLPTDSVERLLSKLIKQRTTTLKADDALRFLFRLDACLYSLQGPKAREYDGGIHTKHRHTQYHRFFVDRIGPGERVLDIGCGDGALTYDVAERAGAHMVGIDIDADYIATARQRHAHSRIEYRLGDALEMLPNRSFDVVILSNVIEHLPERSEFLRKVCRVANPARFLIRVPLFERDWRVPLKKELGVEWRLDKTHQIEYSHESFAEELAAAGLFVNHHETRWGEIWAEALPREDEPP